MSSLNGSYKITVIITSPSTKKKFVLNLPLRKELNTEVEYRLYVLMIRNAIGMMLQLEEWW